ncbi:hypothetical protein MJO28_015305 [Puccinia striiformis f. sp. tritici]|uniref:Uncharacterized protein n=1 Tax=Puccinia striiformis f. sp. tritici TaxID=168172 RepID=A0ACC0DU73_9BASI|nr:hypothetical protein MJO28_015305 [Puccinia striiformis f. sp. tritici]
MQTQSTPPLPLSIVLYSSSVNPASKTRQRTRPAPNSDTEFNFCPIVNQASQPKTGRDSLDLQAVIKRIVPEDFAPSNTKTKHIQHSTDVGPPTEVRPLPSRRRHQHTNDEIDFNFCPSVKKALQSDGHPDPSPAPVPTIVTTAQLKSALEQAGLHVRSQRHSSLLAQYKILLDPSRLVDMSSNKAVSSSADFLSHPPSLPGSEVLSPCHSHSPPTSSESTFMSTQATSSSTSVNDHGTSSTSVNAIAPSGPPPLPPGPHQ